MTDLAIADVQQLSKNVVEDFHDWFIDGVRIANEIGSEMNVPRIVGRQVHRQHAKSSSPEEHYRINTAIPFIDHLESELYKRFDSANCAESSILSLVPSHIANESNLHDLESKLLFWEMDLPTPSSLMSELKKWKRHWSSLPVLQHPTNLTDCLHEVEEDIFPNIRALLMVGCTLPITSSEAERAFSSLRRTKSYLRSRMGEDRLAGLTLMHLHHSHPIDFDKVYQAFISKLNRRMFQTSILYS